MTGEGDENRRLRRAPTNAALAMELVDRLCAPAKLVVKEELALVAMRLNMEFLACSTVGEVACLADVVYHHNPAAITIVHSAIQEGDTCVHILLDFLTSLTYDVSACDAMVNAGVVDTVAGVLPVLTTAGDVRCTAVLQLFDRITDDNDAVALSSDRRRRRRLAIKRLCRVACVRALWNILATDSASSSISPLKLLALALVGKIVTAVATTEASGRLLVAGAEQQVIKHMLARSPQVERTLIILLEDVGRGGHDDGVYRDPHVRRIIEELLARVQHWRACGDGSNVGQISQSNPSHLE